MLLSQVPAFFKTRRQRIAQIAPQAAFLMPSQREQMRNPDVDHPFRQESNFYYLCGFPEPDSFLLVTPQKTVLFVRKKNPEKEMWEGERYGVEGAVRVFGADEAYPIDELEQRLPAVLKDCDQVYYRLGLDETMDRKVLGAIETVRRNQGRSGKGLASILDPAVVLGEMRLFKQPEEIAALRKACQISSEAHRQAMIETRPGMNEFEIEALVDYGFRKKGCQRVGYGSIVAGGRNATCLHYRLNNEALKDGDLLLIDAGGEFDYYTADITRTFPIGKKFTKSQAAVYNLVLKSQLAAIALAKPGTVYSQIHETATKVLIEGFLSLGLLQGKLDEIYKSNEYKRYYPHGTGHWLGMDVHDVGRYQVSGESRKLEPGMVFTVEPGFYVQPDDLDAPVEYRDIGIRIEDNILITEKGCEVMTTAPKTIEEIEALRNGSASV